LSLKPDFWRGWRWVFAEPQKLKPVAMGEYNSKWVSDSILLCSLQHCSAQAVVAAEVMKVQAFPKRTAIVFSRNGRILIDGIEIKFEFSNHVIDNSLEHLNSQNSKPISSKYVLWNIKNFLEAGKTAATQEKIA